MKSVISEVQKETMDAMLANKITGEEAEAIAAWGGQLYRDGFGFGFGIGAVLASIVFSGAVLYGVYVRDKEDKKRK